MSTKIQLYFFLAQLRHSNIGSRMKEISKRLQQWSKDNGNKVKWTKVDYFLGLKKDSMATYTRGRNVSDMDEIQVEVFLGDFPSKPINHMVKTDDEVREFLKESFLSIRGVSKSLGLGNILSQFMCGSRMLPVKRRHEVIRELSKWGLK